MSDVSWRQPPSVPGPEPAEQGFAWRQPPGQKTSSERVPVDRRPGDVTVVDATTLEVPPPAARSCFECGGSVDADGYCTQCGVKAPSERDHIEETPAPWVAAVCDRGVRHPRNEDAVATAAGDAWALLVVCDGVSSSDGSATAALAAARAVRGVLSAVGAGDQAAGAGPAEGDGTGEADPLLALFTRAAKAGNDAVAANTPTGSANPPACTLAAAVVAPGMVHAANIGDSRVYWVGDAGDAALLTRDDSVAGDDIAAGVPRKQAEEGADAHTITRWLGIDADDIVPRVSSRRLPGAGWVLACSDGLWNYASAPEELGRLLQDAVNAGVSEGAPWGGAPAVLDVARRLVRWAIGQGGHDNISVALARVEAVAPTSPAPPSSAQAPPSRGYDPITHEPLEG